MCECVATRWLYYGFCVIFIDVDDTFFSLSTPSILAMFERGMKTVGNNSDNNDDGGRFTKSLEMLMMLMIMMAMMVSCNFRIKWNTD